MRAHPQAVSSFGARINCTFQGAPQLEMEAATANKAFLVFEKYPTGASDWSILFFSTEEKYPFEMGMQALFGCDLTEKTREN
jgi:hypothetical protein